MRINRYIALCGVSSRRGAEELVKTGRVKVNNKTVTELATDIDLDNDTLTVDGIKIQPVNRFIYIMFNKPKGCISTLSDDKGRRTIMDYLTDLEDKRIFPVGRLDYDTEGLLLLTNDGDLSNKLTQPSSEIPKTYIVKINGELSQGELAVLRGGVKIQDGVKLKRCRIKVVNTEVESGVTRLEVTIFEGKNREIHRMFESIDKEVIFLKRIKIGELKLGGLGRGAYRFLTEKETAYLLGL